METPQERVVLVIVESSDPHTDAVKAHLKDLGCRTVVFDPLKHAIAFEIDGANQGVRFCLADGEWWHARQFDAVWYRWKASRCVHWTTPEEKLSKDFALDEWRTVVRSLPALFPPHVPWINAVSPQEQASLKPRQLAVATQMGFVVPATCITNDSAVTSSIFSKHDGVIFKTLTPLFVSERLAYTNSVTRDQVSSAASQIRLAPGIFQERVARFFDVRATVVGTEIFAVRIDSQALETDSAKLDWRRDCLSANYTFVTLDKQVASALLAVHAALELDFAAYDLLIKESGEAVFLECNPAGAWLWIEERCGNAVISSALAKHIARKATQAAPLRQPLAALMAVAAVCARIAQRYPDLVCLPNSEQYSRACTIYNPRKVSRPALILQPRAVSDVVLLVQELAAARRRSSSFTVSVLGGGHNPSGAGLAGTIVIDTKFLQGVEVDTSSMTVRIAAGSTWEQVDACTTAQGVATVGGSCAQVGVVGYVLGGGFGWLSRTHGLGADNVQSIELVTGEGKQVSASAASNPELFWALCGGGNNRFGVVTSVTMRLRKLLPTYAAGTITFQDAAGARLAEILTAASGYIRTVPQSVTVYIYIAGRTAVVEYMVAESGATADAAVAALNDAFKHIDGAVYDHRQWRYVDWQNRHHVNVSDHKYWRSGSSSLFRPL